MRRDVQAVLLLLFGTACIRIGLDGSYLYYVKSILRWPLVASGAVLAALGVLGVLAAFRRSPAAEHGCGEEGSHSHVPRVAWLLTLPVFAILLVSPGPLGAYAAARDPGTVARPAGDSDFPALPPGDPARMQVSEYAVRATWDQGRTLVDRTVALTGFVSQNPAGGWYLTRIELACCAADGIATKVEMRDAQPMANDTWVEVVGTWEPSTAPHPDDAIAAMRAESITVVPIPADPYE
ncbi:MAG: TIGR03943 family putative permease subunit [Sporichthyaceae bacterium]